MVYVVYLFERKLSRGNYTLLGKMEAEKKKFLEGSKGHRGIDLGGLRAVLDHFGASICTLGVNLGRKLHKFGKKVIAFDKLDDYHNEFGYKD